ncbi:MAG: TPM domain-containing protein [Bacteroidales bacterium]|nr:TPM domain-containing protein [Bacteroidales bacterium]MCF8337808.1 TPM domain-containing protein [Bacteroidales bacterium]
MSNSHQKTAKSAKDLFSREDEQSIKQAIMNAELDTSGEIRVHIENTCIGDVMDRAAYVFEKLKMHKTNLRNGVLIYLAVKNRKFAIIGDKGINAIVPDNFWDDIKQHMLNNFRGGDFTKGIAEAVTMTGRQLKTHFPYQSDDQNELSDEISFGRN